MILLDLPPQPPPAALCGPPAPVIKGLKVPSASFSTARAIKAALREMPGAVVNVEDEAPVFLTKLPPSLRFLGGGLRVFAGTGTLAMPVWMDPNVTMSGGNVVGRVYSFGGGGF